jgi:hypothetical protein
MSDTKPRSTPQKVALVTDGVRSAYVNGASLTVDGSWTADASWESLRRSTRK